MGSTVKQLCPNILGLMPPAIKYIVDLEHVPLRVFLRSSKQVLLNQERFFPHRGDLGMCEDRGGAPGIEWAEPGMLLNTLQWTGWSSQHTIQPPTSAVPRLRTPGLDGKDGALCIQLWMCRNLLSGYHAGD